jgi:anti-sigma factor RsiW
VTGTIRYVSDEDLQSFVDGELDPVRQRAMRSHLTASPADAARVEAWRRQNEMLRAAFADLATGPWPPTRVARSRGEHAAALSFPPRSALSETRSGSIRRNTLVTAGMGLAFAAGAATMLAAGLLAQRYDTTEPLRLDRKPQSSPARSSDEPFVDRALRAVARFDPGPERSSAGTASPADVLIVPNLSDAGFRLSGLRAAPGTPSLPPCLLYVTAAEVAITLCIDTAQAEQPRIAREESAQPGASFSWQSFSSRSFSSRSFSWRSFSWRQNGATYSLAGPLAESDLARLADLARKEIDRFLAR